MISKVYTPHALATDPKWLQQAFAEIGTQEVTGGTHNPRVVEYHSCTSLGATDDETPWCSSFLCFVMRQSGIESTRSAASLSWLRWGKELKRPVRGCIVVFERLDDDGLPIPNRGHVALYVGQNEHSVYVLGGNQKNSVGIHAYSKHRVIGYRWPAMASNSTTNMASVTVGAGASTAAAPSVIDVVTQMATQNEQLSGALESAKSLAVDVGIPASDNAALVGLAVVILGLTYIVRERNKKIRQYGI